MPALTTKTGHIDQFLTNYGLKQFNEGATGNASMFGPVIPVQKQSDKYPILDAAYWLRSYDTKGAAGAKAKRGTWGTSSDSFFCDKYHFATGRPFEHFANADAVLKVRQRDTRFVTTILQRDEIRNVAALVGTPSMVGSGVLLTGANKWSDKPNSSPISDVTTGTAFVYNQTGFTPTDAYIDWHTAQILRTHPELLEFHKFTKGGMISLQQVAEAFGVQRVHILQGIENTEREGATEARGNIWGNICLLAKVEQGTSLESASFFASFRWNNPELGGQSFAVKRSRYDRAGEEGEEVVEALHYSDYRVVGPDLAYCIGDTL